MKVIVAVKRVIDYEVEIQVNEHGDGVVTSGVPMSMNPFDEVALEEAIRLKEAGLASHVLAVSLGDDGSQEVLKSALAMGADEALLIHTDNSVEPLTVAKALAYVASEQQADLVLLGKQAIDNDANQTGQMTAALMNCSQGIFVSQLQVDEDKQGLVVQRDTDFGTETLHLSLPAVVTAALRMNEPRFISLPQLMKAKKKTITTCELSSLGLGDIHKLLEVVSVREPDARKPVVMVENVDALAEVINDAMQLS